MMVRRSLPLLFLFVALVFAAAACGPAPNPKGAPYAAAGMADFRPKDIEGGASANGDAVDFVRVKPEEVIRVEANGATLRVGESIETNGGRSEIWRDEPIKGGMAIVRAGVTTDSILFKKGSAAHVWEARPFEPGYYWFELEDRVIAWADGPLPAKFPEVASPNRLDLAGFAKLDEALSKAVKKGASADAAAAIRRIAGLRAVHALRPVTGFPYLTDAVAKASGKGPTITYDERTLHRVSEDEPVQLVAEGPGTLHIWSRAYKEDSDEVADLRVMEGQRERAMGGGTVLRKRMTSYDDPGAENRLASLRRAIVHVPPGTHTYRVESRSGQAFVWGLVSYPIEHIEDMALGTKSESKHLPRAKAACGGSGGNAMCAMAKALAGEDQGDAWAKSVDGLDEDDRAVVDMLAKGGPRDPMVTLEVNASAGDPDALAAIVAAAASDLDENVRGAYERAVARGTTWNLIDTEGPTWTVARMAGSADSSKCKGANADFTELSDKETTVRTKMSHEKHLATLVIDAPCNDKRPVQLEVDGKPMSVSPLKAASILHVVVTGETAKMRVTDAAGARVRVTAGNVPEECRVDVSNVAAPKPAKDNPVLAFDKEHAPGVEVWLRDGESNGTLDVAPADANGGAKGAKTVHFVVGKPKGGIVAIDESGNRWVRAARLLLPEWAAESSVRVTGSEKVAVRAISREARTVGKERDDASGTSSASAQKADAVEPLSEQALVEASRKILTAGKDDHGQSYLARALMLAHGGAELAALEDARAAEQLGSDGAVAKVKAEMRHKPISAGRLTKTAYGVEPDFDTRAVRCTPAETPRVKLAQLVKQFEEKGRGPYDGEIALQIYDVASQIPDDASAEHLLARATMRGKWRLVRDVDGVPRIARPDEKGRQGPLDTDQELRPRVITGAPFGSEDFASVTWDHPAKANLGHNDAVHARVEFACVARAPWEAKGACPFEVGLPGGKTLRTTAGPDGKGTVDVPELKKGSIELRVPNDGAKWTALARIGFDKNLPGTKESDGWFVLEVPHTRHAYIVRGGQEMKAKIKNATLVKVEAIAEGEEASGGAFTLVFDGREETLNAGEQKVVGVRGGLITIKGKTGAAMINVSERVPLEGLDSEEGGAKPPPGTKPKKGPDTTSVDIDAEEAGSYRDTVAKSPPPLSTLEDYAGTVSAHGNYVVGTSHDGSAKSTDLDSYFSSVLEYRRRIESIDLTGTLGGEFRLRRGAPTEGGYIILYEDEGHTRLRFTFTGTVFTQIVGTDRYVSYGPHGFIEYSARLGQDFFVLPRIGYDGYYTNAPEKLPNGNLTNVDNTVYDSYRVKRNSLAFLQLLVWWEPSFNSIFYLRGRGTYDISNGVFQSVQARPGILSVFGQLEADAFFDATYYLANRIDPSAFIPQAGLAFDYNAWAVPGNFALVPVVIGQTRFDGGGYQVTAGLQLLANFRRGLRDYTSLELSFPEQTAGGIPWRGEPR
jgi:hypothetical protein